MFKIPVVLVDNLQDELDKLSQGFAMAGIPCIPIKYENTADRTGIDYIDIDTKDVRVIATDINLLDQTSTLDAKSVYENIGNVIKKISPKGPYCLIFWSQHGGELPSQIINLIEERMGAEINPPLAWGALDKSDFRASDNSQSAPDPNSLLDIIRKVPVFESLLEWENRISTASSDTLFNLYSLAQDSNSAAWNANSTHENLCKLLTHIAHEAVGIDNVLKKPNHAIESGLLSVLGDRLASYSYKSNKKLDEMWVKSLSNLGVKNVLPALTDFECSRLNTFYNIDEKIRDSSKTERGVFLSVPDDLFSNKPRVRVKRVGEKFKSWPDKKKKKMCFFGEFDSSKILKEEFSFGKQPLQEHIINNTRFGWLEIGAVCDHAQRKNRMHKYILGALTLAPEDMSTKGNVKHNGVRKLPDVLLDGERYIFQISFRYHISGHSNSKQLGKPMFRVKDSLLNEILFNWSNQSVRPGITEFKP